MTAVASIRGDGEWEIHTNGTLICGYCGQTESTWAGEPNSAKARPMLALGTLRLTGIWSLAVGPAGELVVVVEVETHTGQPAGHLPHLCTQIPAEAYQRYAAEIAAATSQAT